MGAYGSRRFPRGLPKSGVGGLLTSAVGGVPGGQTVANTGHHLPGLATAVLARARKEVKRADEARAAEEWQAVLDEITDDEPRK